MASALLFGGEPLYVEVECDGDDAAKDAARPDAAKPAISMKEL